MSTTFSDIDPTFAGIIILPIIGAFLGLVNIFVLKSTRLNSVVVPEDTPRLKELVRIAKIIETSAMAFLKKEYSFMAVFVVIMGAVVAGATEDYKMVIGFVMGAFLSGTCGWIGMRVAVIANYKTTYVASLEEGLNRALKVAFASGAVMGFGVVCSGILGLVILYSIFQGLSQDETRYLAGFGFGASAIALFARVGGGIYTKAADVGADLVGKVESDMDEDSPRNPATIADNVGDNVGDVAGMGADLFESFVGSIIAAIQLSQAYAATKYGDADCREYVSFDYCEFLRLPNSDDWTSEQRQDVRALIALPFWIAGAGIICSVIGIQTVRTSAKAMVPKMENGKSVTGPDGQVVMEKNEELQEILLWTIRKGIMFTGFLATIASLIVCGVLFGWSETSWNLFGCNLIGLVAGISIGFFTEYATSFTYKPTQTIAKKSRTGPATVVIQGIGIGMLSTMGPTVIIFIAILACVTLGGTYGIAIAAVGMLSTLGITLATDAFGPVADNAGGLAEMAEFPEDVRETTDGLDALGNTTAATGKGFAIGSAVLAALALLSAYKTDAGITGIDVSKSDVLAGAIFGACLPFLFAAMTMMAVGRAATMMIVEVRAQIKKYELVPPPGTRPEDKEAAIREIVERIKQPGKAPDYERCVAISTQASVYEMIIPGVLAVVAPLFVGFLLGPEALGGMLVGAITCGFMMAVYMANAGGAWDNAKKWVEAGHLVGEDGEIVKKGSAEHAAAVAGDTIGDPFKDTSGPSLNILMKLMTMISLVFAKNQFNGLEPYEKWWIATIIGVVFMSLATGLTLWMRSKGMGKMSSVGKAAKDENAELAPLAP